MIKSIYYGLLRRLALAGTLLSSVVAIASSDVPRITRPLTQFAFPSKAELMDLYDWGRDEKAFDRSYKKLRTHFVGTQLEKARVKRECDKEFKNKSFESPTVENFGCLYWQIQKLAVVQKSKVKERPTSHVKKSKNKKGRTVLPLDFKEMKGAEKTFVLATKNFSDCALTAERATFLREIEELLPEPRAWEMLNIVYDGMMPCVTQSMPEFETIHVRMAMLSLEHGDLGRAQGMFDEALKAVSPSEEHRSLFWRGYIDSTVQQILQGRTGHQDNPFWGKLVNKYPLTLHALVADAALGRDFAVRYKNAPGPLVAVHQGNEWDLYNTTALTFYILGSQDEREGLKRLSLYTLNRVPGLSADTTLFLALCYFKANHLWAGISTIVGMLRDYGADSLSYELLDLMYPEPFKDVILKTSAGIVDPGLVFALARQESTFNPRATSPVGAKGLMQVIDSTAKRMLKRSNINMYDPATNVEAGSKFIRLLLRKYAETPPAALAAYNAGPGWITKWQARYLTPSILLFSDLIPFTETRNYISGITRNMYWYTVLLNRKQIRDGQFVAASHGQPGLRVVDFIPTSVTYGVQQIPTNDVALERVQRPNDL